MERRKGTGSPLRLMIIDPLERIDDRFDAAEFHVGRTRTGTADGASPRSSSIGLLFKRNLGGIGHGLANWPTRGQPPGQSHVLQSKEFRDLWAGLARLAKDFANRSRLPGPLRGSITRELAGYAEASPTWCARESAGLLKTSILAEVPAYGNRSQRREEDREAN